MRRAPLLARLVADQRVAGPPAPVPGQAGQATAQQAAAGLGRAVPLVPRDPLPALTAAGIQPGMPIWILSSAG